MIALIVAMVLCSFAPPDPTGAGAEATTAQASTIVVLGVDDPDAAEQAEAISAHVHGLAEVVTSAARPSSDEPEAWYELAMREAASRSAVAVFWVARADEGHYVLSVVRPERREIRWRRVDVDPTEPFAGLETLGVITRATTSALLADTALQMETTPIPEPALAPTPPPKEPAPPAPAKRSRGRAVLSVGYAGTSYAKELPWQSGMAFEGSWAWPFGLHATLGYTLYERARADTSVGRVEVVRNPIVALLGYHRRWKALGYGGDAGVVVDYSRRRATSNDPDVAAEPDRGRATTALTLRGRASVIAVWRLEVFTAVGVEWWLTGVNYAVEHKSGETEVVVSPYRVRATVTAGLAVRI